ncbi:hypothetical protein WJX72_006443 [[Myrmecia] bisecta]|uniref:Caltractin n=1 Tax=[Myrmecia] bisecta TaxID=41462 RepID=A0AAW1Q4U8_9CHLO
MSRADIPDEELKKEWPFLTRQQVEEFKDAFEIFDRRRTGTFTSADLEWVMKTLGQTPSAAELQTIVRELDADGDGIIDFAEFIVVMMQIVGKAEPEKDLKEVFSVFDRNGNGTISADELRAAIKSIGEELSEQDIEDTIHLADKSGNGEIDYDEFAQFILNDNPVRRTAEQVSAAQPESVVETVPTSSFLIPAIPGIRSMAVSALSRLSSAVRRQPAEQTAGARTTADNIESPALPGSLPRTQTGAVDVMPR